MNDLCGDCPGHFHVVPVTTNGGCRLKVFSPGTPRNCFLCVLYAMDHAHNLCIVTGSNSLELGNYPGGPLASLHQSVQLYPLKVQIQICSNGGTKTNGAPCACKGNHFIIENTPLLYFQFPLDIIKTQQKKGTHWLDQVDPTVQMSYDPISFPLTCRSCAPPHNCLSLPN